MSSSFSIKFSGSPHGGELLLSVVNEHDMSILSPAFADAVEHIMGTAEQADVVSVSELCPEIEGAVSREVIIVADDVANVSSSRKPIEAFGEGGAI